MGVYVGLGCVERVGEGGHYLNVVEQRAVSS